MKQLILLLFSVSSLSCSHRESIWLTNESSFNRPDEPIVLNRSKIDSLFNFRVSNYFPIVLSASGDTIPSQLDDMDGDGAWDELFMLINLKANQSLRLDLMLVDSAMPPAYTKRANIRFARVVEPGKRYVEVNHAERLKSTETQLSQAAFQMEGPAWENDRVAFRNYFDARNGIDIYGKTTSRMVLDSVGTGENYHNLLVWGMDILKVGNSLGAGALAMEESDSLFRLDLPESGNFEQVSDGPLRVIFRLTYNNWNIKGTFIDLTDEISIWGGMYGYQHKVTMSGCANEKILVCGLVNAQTDSLYTMSVAPSFDLCYTHDKQAYGGEYLGLGLVIPAGNFLGFASAPEEGNGIVQTYYGRIKILPGKPVVLRCYAGWELSEKSFSSRKNFSNYLEMETEKWAQPIRINE